MNKNKRILILKRFQKKEQSPATELYYSSPFELLIAAVLSAKTTDISVNKVTAKLYSVANTPKAMLELGVNGIKSYIRNIGLFNNKSRNIIEICRILLKEHGGEVPENKVILQSLPGVGNKTANLVLNVIFRWPVIAVDTHVFRVCNRTKFAPGKNTKKVEEKLLKVVPSKFKINFHHWFVLHGRYTCISRNPCCGSCIIKDLCEYKNKN